MIDLLFTGLMILAGIDFLCILALIILEVHERLHKKIDDWERKLP